MPANTPASSPIEVVLNQDEVHAIRKNIGQLQAEKVFPSLASLFTDAHAYVDAIPRRVRIQLNDFKEKERRSAIIIKANPFSGNECGPTPAAIPPTENDREPAPDEILHVLYGAALGRAFTWETIQSGNLINYVIPIGGHEYRPISSGSANVFDLHTEDAFHAHAGEYLGLFCIRNVEKAVTILASIRGVELPNCDLDVLFEPRFRVEPNIAHSTVGATSLRPLLFGSRDAPYVRANFNFEHAPPNDGAAFAAVESLRRALEANSTHVVLAEGDAMYIDNLTVAHGRLPYAPAIQGSGRWLKRIYMSASFRMSRRLRDSAESSVIKEMGGSHAI
jgi:L-asparagine oxygenase